MAPPPAMKKVYNRGCGKGGVLFTGPDGICDHKVGVVDSTYVGIGTMSPEGTSELNYLWRAAEATTHPLSRNRVVGEIGWNIQSYRDDSLLQSGQQILRGEFRQLGEDRHTHLYQNPWTPKPDTCEYLKDRYGREIFDTPNLNVQTSISCGGRCQCLQKAKKEKEKNCEKKSSKPCISPNIS